MRSLLAGMWLTKISFIIKSTKEINCPHGHVLKHQALLSGHRYEHALAMSKLGTIAHDRHETTIYSSEKFRDGDLLEYKVILGPTSLLCYWEKW